jgi:hypothetical protein
MRLGFHGFGAMAVLALTGATPAAAVTRDGDPRCFELSLPGTPEATPDATGTVETWCYELADTGDGAAWLVYNADQEEPRLELSALARIEPDGGIGEVAHGSLARGELSVHRFRIPGFSPFSVPLHPAEAAISGARMAWGPAARASRKLDGILSRLAGAGQERIAATVRLRPGVEEASVEAAKLPYGAYWWPHSGIPLALPEDAPLRKYDRIVKNWTGRDPKSVDWEIATHSLQNVDWGGHCNGWAASSVLYREPETALWDSGTQQVIKITDINGMLTEASFCVNWAFYGSRYRTSADDPKDIHPDRFHKVLEYTIKKLKKPVAHDYRWWESVDNHVITGYRFEITADPAQARQFNVKATLQISGYDSDRYEATGPARQYAREYLYTLTTDAAGEITGGAWISENPDFLWVPLSQSNCGRENPRIDPAQIERIMRLPPATAEQLLLQ